MMPEPPTINMDEFEPEDHRDQYGRHRSEENPDMCPVCAKKTQVESLEAEGLVLSGVKGILYHDGKLIEDVMEASDKYTAHTAISLYAKSMFDICELIGADWREIIDAYREQITAALHDASGED
jgi:hypothetical protein